MSQMQYELPEGGDDEDEEGTLDADDINSIQDMKHEDVESDEPLPRKVCAPLCKRMTLVAQQQLMICFAQVAILLELLAAGGNLDSKISQFRDEIDMEMLEVVHSLCFLCSVQRSKRAKYCLSHHIAQLLEARIETARSYEAQNSPAVQNLEDMYRTLKVVYQRNSATPAMRLLDDVLDILADTSTPGDDDPFSSDPDSEKGAAARLAGSVARRQREAAARMRTAFTGGVPGGCGEHRPHLSGFR